MDPRQDPKNRKMMEKEKGKGKGARSCCVALSFLLVLLIAMYTFLIIEAFVARRIDWRDIGDDGQRQKMNNATFKILREYYPNMPEHLFETADREGIMAYVAEHREEAREVEAKRKVTWEDADTIVKLTQNNKFIYDRMAPMMEAYTGEKDNFLLNDKNYTALENAIKKASEKEPQKEKIRKMMNGE